MTRGQESLTIDMGSAPALSAIVSRHGLEAARAALVVILPTEEELAAHAAYLAALDRESRGPLRRWLRRQARGLTRACRSRPSCAL